MTASRPEQTTRSPMRSAGNSMSRAALSRDITSVMPGRLATKSNTSVSGMDRSVGKCTCANEPKAP